VSSEVCVVRVLAVGLLVVVAAGCAGAPGRTAVPSPSRTGASGRWAPAVRTAWQWQLTTPVDLRVNAPVYDIDGFENPASVVAALHRRGRHVICYINVGAYESFRPDHSAFPAAVLGRGDGWPGERWLDIRRLRVLEPIMARRFDMCRAKGFDAIEPDLVEGYANRTGFPLRAADQLTYNRLIAKLAHDRGLSVGLKNDLGQITKLSGIFDFAVNEQCVQYAECAALRPFIAAGKVVLHVEYELAPRAFCRVTKPLGFSSMRKRLSLDAWRLPC
jgi:hypothetical protein